MTSQGIKVLAVAAALAAIAIVVPNTNSFIILLTTRALAFSILVMSVDVLLGYTGLPSLGQAAYLGSGAYLTAILATRYQFGLGYDFWLVVVLGILIAAALAAVFGLLAIRATGVYFLMITLALGQCAWGLAYRWNSLTGGDNGINLRGRPKFGIDLADEMTFFYLVLAFFAVSLLLMYTLVRSPFGRSLAGIRERELRMQILGYNTWLHKYLAFIIAGGFGGLSGVLWAHTAGIVSPENVVLTTSVDALLMVVLGGSGTLVGGAIGAVIVIALREYLSTVVPWWQYLLGAVYLLTILYLPTGPMGIPQLRRQGAPGTPVGEEAQAKPDTGVTKAKKVILQDKVQIFIGGVLASSGSALAPVSTAEKTVYISPVAAADDLTQRQLDQYPYFIRTGWTSSQPSHPFGKWACEQGYKKIAIVAADYAFGYEAAGGFHKSFEDCGGKIVQQIWPPLGTTDFG